MNTQKITSFALKSFYAIMILALSLTGYDVWSQSHVNAQNDIVNTLSIGADGWASYADHKYGYSFLYPKTWIAISPPSDGWGGGAQLLSDNLMSKSDDQFTGFSDQTIKIELHALENQTLLSSKEFLAFQDQPLEYLDTGFKVIYSEETQIAGYYAIARTWEEGEITGKTYYIFVDSLVYAIQKIPATSIYDKDFEKLLSTLEFSPQRLENVRYSYPTDIITPIAKAAIEASTPPNLKFPWAGGSSWYYTGGPHPFYGKTINSGIDFAPSSDNHDLLAIASGKVTFINWLDGMSGNTMKIDHGDGWESWYLHLIGHSYNVQVNSQVPQGGFIAIAGGSGTGGASIHAHIDLRRYGQEQAWHNNYIDGWRISENCIGINPGIGCIDGVYNGYIEKDGRQVVPESSPGESQLVASSNTAIYACFPVSASSPLSEIDPSNTCFVGDDATFVADVTVPDNSTISSGQAFTKIWRIANSGSTTWGSGYSLVFTGGDQMGAPSSVSIPSTSSGSTTDISINMVAPITNGYYVGYWRMKNSQGQLFGDVIWVKIKVENASSGQWSVEYFNDKNLGGHCGSNSTDGSTYIFKNWGDGAPANGCNSDNFSVRFTKTVYFPGGNYSFHCQHDDGCRLYIDGQMKGDWWWSSNFEGHDWGGSISSGNHEVKIEMYDSGGQAKLEAFWSGPGFLPTEPSCVDNEWCASYYGNKELAGTAAINRSEGIGNISYDLGGASIGYGFPSDNYSVRWHRDVHFDAGRYRFHIVVDDGGRLWVNNTKVIDQWKDQGGVEYTIDMDLSRGEIPITFEYYENGGGAIAKLWWDVLATYSPVFYDVPYSYWANSFIEKLYNNNVTGGCSTFPFNYCPSQAVTRAQMAIFILRAKYGSTYTPPAATGTIFSDVPLDFWAGAWIEALAAEGITGGCGNGRYCPDLVLTRDQMAVFLLRGKHGSGYTPPAMSGTLFDDIPSGYWAGAWIEALANEGITGGCGGGNYCPGTPVARDQMAVFIVTAFSLP